MNSSNASSPETQARLRAKAELESRRRARAKAVAGSIDEWRTDPVLFATEALGVKMWPKQEDILRATCLHRRVAVRSGHKIGKSTVAAIAALWFVVCFPGARVVLLASSGHQVRNILWRDVRRMYFRACIPLGGTIGVTPGNGLKFEDGREIIGLSTDKAERAAGLSGANILFIFDEASGIPQTIFEAIEGNSASENARWLLFSNPTQTSGEFFDAFHKRRSFYGATITVSSIEASKYAHLFPGLAAPSWCDEMLRKHGPGSPMYHIRVLGQFARSNANAIVTLAMLHEARVRREAEIEAPKGVLSIGVDVARFGDDDSVITPVRGTHAYPQDVVHGLDTQEVAARALIIADRHRTDDEIPIVKVDVCGVGGGVADALRPHHNRGRLILVEVNSASTAEEPEEFANVRAEMHFQCAEWFEHGGTVEDDSDGVLHDDLVAPTYDIDPKGRRRVEPKDAIKKRIGRSPDHGDSLMLAVYRASRPMPIRKPRSTGGTGRLAHNERGF